MSQITTPGTHQVTITGAVWTEAKDNKGLIANLTGSNGKGESITAFMAATETLIKSGRNAGVSMFAQTMETLKKLGMSDDPTDIGSIVGKEANFVCSMDTYNGEDRLRVDFVNPAFRESAKPAVINSFFTKMGYAAAPAPAANPADEIPI